MQRPVGKKGFNGTTSVTDWRCDGNSHQEENEFGAPLGFMRRVIATEEDPLGFYRPCSRAIT